jgi:hypothetical protein
MPFTFSHPAIFAVFKKYQLALIIGSINAPDFEYFFE